MSGRAFDLRGVIEDTKAVIFSPQRFYRDMPATGGYVKPAIFVLVTTAVSAIVLLVLNLLGLGIADPLGSSGFLLLLAVPLGSLLATVIVAAILFAVWRLMGSTKNYELAFRCVAYSMAIAPIVALLSIIPYLGSIVRAIWGCTLLYLASLKVHNLKEQTAKLVFGALAAVSVLMLVKGESFNRNLVESRQNFDGRLHDMTPEETGKAVGEILKGLEKAAREAEEAANN